MGSIEMHKPLVKIIGLLIALGATYLVIVAVIGSRVASEIAGYEALLVARDDVNVTRFEYERGFFGGTLDYDLDWRPLPDDAFYEALQMAAMVAGEINLTGTFETQHGPWLGRSGFGLAKIEQQIQVPEQLRNSLPQYPGQQPLLELASVLTFTGALRTDFAIVDYDGRVIVDDEVLNLQVSGLTGSLAINNSLTQFTGDLNLRQLAAGMLGNNAQSVGFSLDGLQFKIDLWEDESSALLGDTEFRFAQFSFHSSQENMQALVRDFSAISNVFRVNDQVDNTGSMAVANFSLNGHELGGMALETAVRGINIDTYVALQNLYRQAGVSGQSELDMEAIMAELQKIAADQLTFSLDKLVFFLPTDEDIVASLVLTYNGSPQIDWQSTEQQLAAISLESSLRISISAIERSIASSSLSAEQKAQLQSMLQEIYQLPYVNVSGDTASSSLAIRQGEVLVNEERVMAMADLLPFIDAAANSFSNAASDDEFFGNNAGATSATAADFGEPLFERVDLQANFMPDPYSVELIAGGEGDARELAVYCAGNINLVQPDVTLSFDAGTLPLFVYAEAEIDTTLVVLAPDGWHCNDDAYGGYQPALEFENPQSGEYLIWVGTYEKEQGDATLFISELDPR